MLYWKNKRTTNDNSDTKYNNDNPDTKYNNELIEHTLTEQIPHIINNINDIPNTEDIDNNKKNTIFANDLKNSDINNFFNKVKPIVPLNNHSFSNNNALDNNNILNNNSVLNNVSGNNNFNNKNFNNKNFYNNNSFNNNNNSFNNKSFNNNGFNNNNVNGLQNSDIFNLDNISNEHKQNLYDSVDKSAIYVTYPKNAQNYSDKKFIIKNYRQTTIGYFTVIELLRYLIIPYDKGDFFIKKIFNISVINDDIYSSGKAIIKKYILKREKIQNSENEYIKLLDFKKSPFMSNLQMLIYLNRDIISIEKQFNVYSFEYKNTYYDNYDTIISIVSELIYKLLSYTLKLVTIISSKINKTINKDNYEKMNKIKNSLYVYSLQIISKISDHVNKNFSNIDLEQKKIENLIKENRQLKHIIEEKLNNNVNMLTVQNDLLDKNLKYCKK